MDPEETVRAYYAALRRGDPLEPFFAERDDAVKFGVSERLDGHDEIAAGLREQTRTTEGWTVDSRRLRTARRGPVAWFSDEVGLAWRDVRDGREHAFETRWSGTLSRHGDDWRFVGMHVSAPHELG